MNAVVVALATAAVLAGCAGARSGSRSPSTSSSTVAPTTSTTLRTTTLTATLTGGAVVPGPGGPEASGAARVTPDPGAGQVCWDVTVSRVDVPTAAHLHTAPHAAVGPVTVVLTAAPSGPASGCAAVPPEVAASVAANPAGFYVDVHTEAFPAGAARGQLGR